MGKLLYLECYSGISGDMTVGALLDLGASREKLERALESLGIEGYHLHFGRTKKCGIDACDFDVHLEEDAGAEGGEHEHGEHGLGEHGSGGHGHGPGGHEHGEHEHGPGGHEHGGHGHGSGGHGHAEAECSREARPRGQGGRDRPSHCHRNLQDIRRLLERLDAGPGVRERAEKIFSVVAGAEARVHGLPVEEVHFHEVGAVDSIVDIVGTAVCLEDLGVDEVVVSPLYEGRGFARCQHGVLPVPVPATAQIAADFGLELRVTDNDGEMVTPTGAAIAAALKTRERLPEGCRIEKIGIGAGKKEFPNANILRAMLMRTAAGKERMEVLETNIDDCGGEALGYTMERLLEAGAADVWFTPIYMKKNRPAFQLSVLCAASAREKIEGLIFSHTTTIGIRRYPVERSALERREMAVSTEYGEARVKVCEHRGRTFCYPEYESVRRLSIENQEDFGRVYDSAVRAAEEAFA